MKNKSRNVDEHTTRFVFVQNELLSMYNRDDGQFNAYANATTFDELNACALQFNDESISDCARQHALTTSRVRRSMRQLIASIDDIDELNAMHRAMINLKGEHDARVCFMKKSFNDQADQFCIDVQRFIEQHEFWKNFDHATFNDESRNVRTFDIEGDDDESVSIQIIR